MRLFVAVDLPAELKEALDERVVAPLRPALPEARWSRPEGRHLTLKFLGEVPEGRIPAMAEALRSAAAGHRRFRAAFETVGGFPNLRRPRVLWVGIGPGRESLTALAAEVEARLGPLGFAPENRPFKAHLTLARFKNPRPVGELPAVEVPSQSFEVAEVVLFRSQVHPKGARYTPLEVFPLSEIS